MTYIAIDTNKKQALLFLEYVKTLPFVTIYQEPNPTTLKAMVEVKKGKSKKHKSSKALISYLNK
jgi:antitoxin component of RelBE/YafQ-DinJ toxin-antitoxin module